LTSSATIEADYQNIRVNSETKILSRPADIDVKDWIEVKIETNDEILVEFGGGPY